MDITLPPKQLAKIKVSATLGDTPENEVALCQVIEGDSNLHDYRTKNDYSRLYIGEWKEGN